MTWPSLSDSSAAIVTSARKAFVNFTNISVASSSSSTRSDQEVGLIYYSWNYQSLRLVLAVSFD